MKTRAFIIAAISLLILSCGKEAAVDRSMETIAGEYVLSQYCINSKQQILPDGKQYSDLKAEVVKTDGQWYFNCDMPIMKGTDACIYKKVNQPISWSPVLNRFVVVGNESSLAEQTGYPAGLTFLYYNTKKNMIGLDIYEDNTNNRFDSGLKGWYHWSKK